MSRQLIKELKNELGKGAVLSGAATVVKGGYARLGKIPVGVVLPEDVEQLRAVLTIAAGSNVSLWVLPNIAANGG